MSYLYASNLDSLDRRDQLEIQLDNGNTAILRVGHFYDLTAGELARARKYAVLTYSATLPDEEPIGVVYLPLKGNPVDGEIPLWDSADGAFVPGPVPSSSTGIYWVIRDRGGQANAQPAGTYIFLPDTFSSPTASTGARAQFYFDPARYTLTGLTAKLRIDAAIVTNAVNPGVALTMGLYPITASGGGATAVTVTLGTVITGSTIALTPGANAQVAGSSADFNPPAAGHYALGCVVATGGMAASSAAVIRTALMQRWV